MKNNTRLIAWSLYFLSLIFLIIGVFVHLDKKIPYFSIGAIIQSVPWVICIAHSTRSKDNSNGLWTYFIIFFGTIAIPMYLLKANRENQLVG